MDDETLSKQEEGEMISEKNSDIEENWIDQTIRSTRRSVAEFITSYITPNDSHQTVFEEDNEENEPLSPMKPPTPPPSPPSSPTSSHSQKEFTLNAGNDRERRIRPSRSRRNTVLSDLFTKQKGDSKEGEVDSDRLATIRKRSALTLLEILTADEEGQSLLSKACYEFNLKPVKGRKFLMDEAVISSEPADFANFLFHFSERLSKRRVGEYIGGSSDIQEAVCEALFSRYDFAGMSLDEGLRTLLRQFRLPGESQEIDRIMEKFAQIYVSHNPNGPFQNDDTGLFDIITNSLLLNFLCCLLVSLHPLLLFGDAQHRPPFPQHCRLEEDLL